MITAEQIYADYFQKVQAYVRGKVQAPHEVEDLVSAIFLKVVQKLDSYDPAKASVSTWVYAFTRNTVTDYFRTRRTLVSLEDYMVDEKPEQELNDDALEILADALLTLNEKQRDLIVLHYYKGYTLKVVAEMMGMSYINAKVIHKKALDDLRHFMRPTKKIKRGRTMTENMRKFLEAVSQNEEMTAKVGAMGKEELIALAKELGPSHIRVNCVAPGVINTDMVQVLGQETLQELAQQTPGLTLLIEPYGTGGQRPFRVLDIYRILDAAKGAVVATEFWTYPNWGWKDMGQHEKVMRNLQRPILYAEAFTCWPLKAWQDDPQSLKAVCDRAFCMGVNRMMLHAGAANPWLDVEPGMSFGIWGTQFVPKQTWWKAGGAKELFGYMARCQSLLQRGVPAKEQLPALPHFKTYRRTDGDTDIYFICNPTAQAKTDALTLPLAGHSAEIWDPYTKEMNLLGVQEFRSSDDSIARHFIPLPSGGTGGGSPISLTIEPYGSRFIILRPGTTDKPSATEYSTVNSIPVTGSWTVEFAQEGKTLTLDSLTSWTEQADKEIKYFSGTATYRIDLPLKKKQLKDKEARYILSLGELKNMARVTVNGTAFPILWKAPFECDITEALVKGNNRIEVEVTNLWPNRMIGDEQEPEDVEWGETLKYDFAPGSPVAGQYMAKLPDWLLQGKPRPSQGRKSFYAFKFFRADSPLLPSGLFGPVEVLVKKGK